MSFSENKSDDETSHPRGIIRMGSAGILQVSADERARILNQQRHLSLQRRGRASSQSSIVTSTSDIDSDVLFTSTMRHFSAPKGPSSSITNEDKNRRSTLPNAEFDSTLEYEHVSSKIEVRRDTLPSYVKFDMEECIVNQEQMHPKNYNRKKMHKKTLSTTNVTELNTKPHRKATHDRKNQEQARPFTKNQEYYDYSPNDNDTNPKSEDLGTTKGSSINDDVHHSDMKRNIVYSNELGKNELRETIYSDGDSIETEAEIEHGNPIHIIGAELGAETNERIQNDDFKFHPSSSMGFNLDNIDDLNRFVMHPVTSPLQCYIRRSRKSILKPVEYTVYLKDGDKFLMFSRKRANKKTSNYLIFTEFDKANKENDDDERQGHIVGKLRANFLGTEFTIYDSGINPLHLDPSANKDYADTVRCELGCVSYETNVLGSRGPRRMQVCINKIDEETNKPMKRWQPVHSDEQMITHLRETHSLSNFLVRMKNKEPKWNDQLDAYVLNFNGRVTMASVKNFQLVVENDSDERIILQFGRVSKDEFTMDLDWPMSPMQAFCICLSSFDSKLACD